MINVTRRIVAIVAAVMMTSAAIATDVVIELPNGTTEAYNSNQYSRLRTIYYVLTTRMKLSESEVYFTHGTDVVDWSIDLNTYDLATDNVFKMQYRKHHGAMEQIDERFVETKDFYIKIDKDIKKSGSFVVKIDNMMLDHYDFNNGVKVYNSENKVVTPIISVFDGCTKEDYTQRRFFELAFTALQQLSAGNYRLSINVEKGTDELTADLKYYYDSVYVEIDESSVVEPNRLTLEVNNEDFGFVDFDFMDETGRNIKIIAEAYEGYHFEGWSDGVNDAERVVVLVSDSTIVATFAADAPKTSIDAPQSADVYVMNGAILVNNVAPEYVMNVYGQNVANVNLCSGVYLVATDDSIRKIIIK